jgi:uncharacterized coiled-coil protein SlyX
MFGPKWQEGRVEAIESRLSKLEASIEKLERDRRQILTEWESTFEKFNALWARLSRRMRERNGPRRAADEPPEQELPERPINPLAARLLTYGGR